VSENNECRDCHRHMLLFARRLCAACYKLRWKHGKRWDGPPPRSERRIHRTGPVNGPGVCPDCRRWCERRGARGFCANCYRIRRDAGDYECAGPPPDVPRPTEWPARGHWTVEGRPAPPAANPSEKVDWRAMADVIRVLR
jgi:hypothetical protein